MLGVTIGGGNERFSFAQICMVMTSYSNCYLWAGPSFYRSENDNINNNSRYKDESRHRYNSDLDLEFSGLYLQASHLLRRLLFAPASSTVCWMDGEGMLALWAGLKSTIPTTAAPNRILCVGNGVYGRGIYRMIKQHLSNYIETVTPVVELYQGVSGSDDRDPGECFLQRLLQTIKQFKPNLLTLVHCDTPTGSWIHGDSMQAIGECLHSLSPDGLFYVDIVSSAGGWLVDLEKWQVDIAVMASHKCLGLPVGGCGVVLSERAVARVKERRYLAGYDALLPWVESIERLKATVNLDFNIVDGKCLICHPIRPSSESVVDENINYAMPYTVNFDGLHQLVHRLQDDLLKFSGDTFASSPQAEWELIDKYRLGYYVEREPALVRVWLRHLISQQFCLERLKQAPGLEPYQLNPDTRSPTCTAIKLPIGQKWIDWKRELKQHGIHLSGTVLNAINPEENPVDKAADQGAEQVQLIRIGHMGAGVQTDIPNALSRAMGVICEIASQQNCK